MKVAIGTKNKAKVQAVQQIVSSFYAATFETVAVASEVREQPLSSEETRQGAINRAINALQQTDATIAFGLEGGVTQIEGQLYICNWAALATATTVYTAAGAQIPLPTTVAEAVIAGEALGPVMARYAKQADVSQNQGAIGVFTNELVTRQTMFEHILLLLIGQYQYN